MSATVFNRARKLVEHRINLNMFAYLLVLADKTPALGKAGRQSLQHQKIVEVRGI